MPLDWYVNASSFDQSTSRYFALLNMFPSLPNATLNQQLVVADFSQPPVPPAPSPTTIYQLSPDGPVWHFLGWNPVLKGLFGTNQQYSSPLRPALPGLAHFIWADLSLSHFDCGFTGIGVGPGVTDPFQTTAWLLQFDFQMQVYIYVFPLETDARTFPGPLVIDPNSKTFEPCNAGGI
jgi:hypothetical protein